MTSTLDLHQGKRSSRIRVGKRSSFRGHSRHVLFHVKRHYFHEKLNSEACSVTIETASKLVRSRLKGHQPLKMSRQLDVALGGFEEITEDSHWALYEIEPECNFESNADTAMHPSTNEGDHASS